MIDLRSDTVTLPSREMRIAMAEAPVGDDVYQEDPSVIQLEKMSAEILGKEAGLFVSSGTMGNLIAALVSCQRGEEVILGHLSHIFRHEVGGISALGGIMAHTLPNLADGSLDLELLEDSIRGDDLHEPRTKMIALENTHNGCGGVALTPDYLQSMVSLVSKHGLWLHVDGARIFNAAAKCAVPVAKLLEGVDSVTFCLSKGLGAPVGSVLCGSDAFIEKARKIRKQLGGGMRQAGIIAAGGIYALTHNVERLIEDHERAQRLAEGLRLIPGILLLYNSPQTNMVFLGLDFSPAIDMDQLIVFLRASGILADYANPSVLRLVTHINITNRDIEAVISAFRRFYDDGFLQGR